MSNADTDSDSANKEQSDDLRIAWRYSQSAKPQQEDFHSTKTYQANYFVMNKFMNQEDLNDLISFETKTESDDLYSQLSDCIQRHIDDLNFNITKTKKYTNILRIVINSLGGLVWNDQSSLNDSAESLCRFLFHLRALLRQSLAVCLITVPNEVVRNQTLMQQYSHLSDYVFIFDDSKSSLSRLVKTQYNGLFRLIKLPSLNSLNQCFAPDCLDLAFYVKKKRLIVEQLHLPPDLGENDDTQKGRTSSAVTMSCTSGGRAASGTNKLDF